MISKEHFKDLLEEFDEKNISLIAVSKTRTIEEMKVLSGWGQIDFGENRIEEIKRKSQMISEDIRWHLIGPLQSKKVKTVEKNIHLLHALDRLKVWKKLNERMEKLDHHIDVLIQVHIAREESKYGFDYDEVRGLFEQKIHLDFPRVHVVGLMGMATFTEDHNIVRSEFDQLKTLFDEIREKYYDYDENNSFNILSMGMSSDYTTAIDSGSNMVRIGTLLFGPRVAN